MKPTALARQYTTSSQKTLEGEIDDEVVIPGNHRDAWTAGAGDPGSAQPH